MKKIHRRFLALGLLLVLTLSLLPLTALAAGSGACGENASWSMTDDNVLTISGTGATYDYSGGLSGPPWDTGPNRAEKIIIEPGITHIGAYNFLACSNSLQELSLPEGLLSIGEGAFQELAFNVPLPELKLPSTLQVIGKQAFRSIFGFVSVTIPASVTYVGEDAFADNYFLERVYFEGDAPVFGENAFQGTEATIYYPAGNPTWTEAVMQNYGGTLTWQAWDMEPELSFTDLDETAFYMTPVIWAVRNGITGGISNTSFGPLETCSRAQVVTFLWRAEGEPTPTTTATSFTDVVPGQFYYDAVLWAAEKGITGGVSETEFGTLQNVTRGQFVTFLHRALGKPAYTIGNPFTDLDSSAFYMDAVLWATQYGVTGGISATAFGPLDPCTRGQVVTFLYRAYT